MTVGQLKQALQSKPFTPFRIKTADGGEYRVNHPDMVWMNPQAQRTFVVATEAEAYAVVDLLLVSALEFEGTSNGA